MIMEGSCNEVLQIATTMIKIGKQLSRGPVVTGDEEPKMETRTLKVTGYVANLPI